MRNAAKICFHGPVQPNDLRRSAGPCPWPRKRRAGCPYANTCGRRGRGETPCRSARPYGGGRNRKTGKPWGRTKHGAMAHVCSSSPDGAQRNPGADSAIPDCAALHPGYEGSAGCLTVEERERARSRSASASLRGAKRRSNPAAREARLLKKLWFRGAPAGAQLGLLRSARNDAEVPRSRLLPLLAPRASVAPVSPACCGFSKRSRSHKKTR